MVKRTAALLWIYATLLAAGNAWAAADITGGELLEICTADQNDGTKRLRCVAYIQGAWSGLEVGFSVAEMAHEDVPHSHNTRYEHLTADDQSLCAPFGVTVGQVAKVFVKYANDHPEDLHNPAAVMMMGAFVTGFCPPLEGE